MVDLFREDLTSLPGTVPLTGTQQTLLVEALQATLHADIMLDPSGQHLAGPLLRDPASQLFPARLLHCACICLHSSALPDLFEGASQVCPAGLLQRRIGAAVDFLLDPSLDLHMVRTGLIS